MTSALRKACAAGIMPAHGGGRGALNDCWRLRIERVAPDMDLHRRALRWAARLGQRAAYDAQYLALAERLGAEFYTADRRLANLAGAAGLPWVRFLLSTA